MEVVEGETFLSNKDYYELEYIYFMIEVLKPFIEFKRVSSRGCSVRSGQGTDQIRIYLKRSSEMIDKKQFIHFIQITFPEKIKEEINNVEYSISRKNLYNAEKKIFKAFLEMDRNDFKNEYVLQSDKNDSTIATKFLNSNYVEIDKYRTYYGIPIPNNDHVEGCSALPEAEKIINFKNELTYFNKLLTFNFHKHKQIEDVLKFINSLDYVI
tara:strand:+ start:3308 stop:3940 length:633 start_codon:yes stop_codon:yes gene_type:complete